MMENHNNLSLDDSEKLKAADYIYHEWDAALSENDTDRIMLLYHHDAVLESPLVPHLMGAGHNICKGADEIRKFIELVTPRKPVKRKFYRHQYFTDGKTLMWEYPRLSPEGEQMDFVEIMELEDGLIKYHRVYWGCYGFNILNKDEYHR